MKKRTKITLRTKIYLTIVALLALIGVFYAQNPPPSHPVPFSGQVPFPTGVAAAPDLLLVSEFCTDNIDKLDCNGTASLFATLPSFGSCREKYMTIAPLQSENAVPPFTRRDVFVTLGTQVFKATPPTATLFATLPGCTSTDHSGITFDHFGTFGNDMIVTCQQGNVYRVNGNGTATLIANVFASGPLTDGEIEGPAVVPIGFGPHGGEIWVADESNNAVHAIKNTAGVYTVTQSIISHVNTEAVYVIPNPPCTFTPAGCQQGQGNGAFFLAEQQMLQLVWKYPLADFTVPPIGGNVILTSESGADNADTSLIKVSGGNYVQSSFGPRVGGTNEGASMVDCDVPTATPTTTPTATFTPTATATATATFTPTPTATATFTPTPTPTVTPTPTPTPTPGGFACQESTSIQANFNNFAIAPGNFLWFSSVLKANHLPTNAVVHVTFTNQTITIPGFGTVNVPDSTVTFDPAAVSASTTFAGTWSTTVPSSIKGNTFFSGHSVQIPLGLPGSVKPTWSGTISIDTPGVSVNWQWAAANYPTFSANDGALGVKSVDDKTLDPLYQNSDHAGTPENFKQFVVGGGTGGGGANYTGSLSSTASVCR